MAGPIKRYLVTTTIDPTGSANVGADRLANNSGANTVEVGTSGVPNTGDVLTAIGGGAATWQAPSGGGLPVDPTVYTANFTATPNMEHRFKYSGVGLVVTLPLSPAVGDRVLLRSIANPSDSSDYAVFIDGTSKYIRTLGSTSTFISLRHGQGFYASFIFTGQAGPPSYWTLETDSLDALAPLGTGSGLTTVPYLDGFGRLLTAPAFSSHNYLSATSSSVALTTIASGQMLGRTLGGSSFSTPLAAYNVANLASRGLDGFAAGFGPSVGNNNDILLGTNWDRSRAHNVSPAGAGAVLTGIVPAASDFYGFVPRKLIYNSGSDAFDITHEDANSSAANRFRTKNGLTYTVSPGSHVWIEYINVAGGRWFVD